MRNVPALAEFRTTGRPTGGPWASLWALAAVLVLVGGCWGSPGKSHATAGQKSEAATPSAGSASAGSASAGSASSGSATSSGANATSAPSSSAKQATPAEDPGAAHDSLAEKNQLQEDLIESVVDSLNHLDRYDPGQMLPKLSERLNQWMWQTGSTGRWQLDPLLGTLEPRLAAAPLVDDVVKKLDTGIFTMNDMIGLQETVWLRDIARHARGSELDDLSVAEHLFDWTVRNLQLVDEPSADKPGAERSPLEILLLGRATARERAWIFLLLLRQQGLDGVMLAIPGQGDAPPREWLPAMVTDTDLVLFDPWLGMPLPGPDGKRIATLSDVAENDSLLRSLDLDSSRPYPVKAEQLDKVVAYVEASPNYLSRRMEKLDERMTGELRMVLFCKPGDLAARLAGRPHVGQVRYWPLAYEFMRTRGELKPGEVPASAAAMVVFQAVPDLSHARILQFKGEFEGPRGAMAFYRASRPPKDKLVRMPPEQRQICETAKQDASYWLGLIKFEQQEYAVAKDYFDLRVLQATPEGPWTDGAHYNLGRSYEAMALWPEAIDMYQSDSSPQKHGNRLRARRLKAQAASQQAAGEK